MAQAVEALPRAAWTFRPSPEVAFGIRLAVAVCAAIWLGKAPGLVDNNSSWILITVLMVMQPQTGGSLLKGLLRAVGTAAAALTSILLFGFAAQDPPLLVAGLFAVQAIAAYGNAGPRFQYAWFVWAFTTAVILGAVVTGGEAVETVAFQRASMVTIGILLVFVVDTLLWPQRAEPTLRASLASRARALGGALRRVVAGARGAGADPVFGDPSVLSKQLGMLDGVRHELGVSRQRADVLLHTVMLLETLAARGRAVSGFDPPPVSVAEDERLGPALEDLGRALERALDAVARSLEEARGVAPFVEGLETTLTALDERRARFTERHGWSISQEGEAAQLRDIVAVLESLQETLSVADRQRPGAPASVPRFRVDPFRTKIALRTGFAVVLAFLIPMAFGWKVNSIVGPTAFMTAAFARGTAAQAIKLLAFIVVVGWAVADLALVYWMPHVERVPLGLLYPFLVAGTFGIIGARQPLLAMLPSNGSLLAILPLYGGSAPPTDVYGTYNLVSYLALGLGTGWVFSRVMWPATASGLFRQRCAVQLDLCLQRIRPAAEGEARSDAARDADFVRAFATHAGQLASLHREASLEPVERGLDTARRAELLAAIANLYDAALGFRPVGVPGLEERCGPELTGLLGLLERQDAAAAAQLEAVAAALRGERPADASDLDDAVRAVEERLAALRERPEVLAPLTRQDARALLERVDAGRRLATRLQALDAQRRDWQRGEVGGAMSTRPGGVG